MTKQEFLQILSEGYFDGCVVETQEILVVDGSNSQIYGVYDLLDMQSTVDFFTANYDETMTRAGHGTRIVSLEFSQKEEIKQ